MSATETSLDSECSLAEPGTIIQNFPPLNQKYPRRQSQIRLAYDILEIIIAQVFLDHRDDLFTICMASKQLYLACIPWIYRRITIDFSSLVGVTFLLRRLARASSELSVFVRDVALKKCSSASKDSQDWVILEKCLSRFTNLSNLSCDDATCLPDFVLNSIQNLHPRTMFQAGIPWTSTIGLKNPNLSFFNSGVLNQLTSFEFSARGDAVLYYTFKQDLLQLLIKASNLAHLCIYQGPIQILSFTVFPSMISVFQANRLPRLVSLQMVTRSIIFTRDELEAWGVQEGWSRLRQLKLYRAYNLIPFISRVPNLVHLSIATPEGMKELEEHLKLHTNAPFGMVTTLNYSHFIDNLYDRTHVMPWAILKKISATLIQYTSWHQPLEVFNPGYAVPTAANLRRLLTICPRVTHLELDIMVIAKMWPRDILRQLADFHNVRELSLYIHEPIERSRTSIRCASGLDFGEAFQFLTITERGSVSNPKLRVNFTEVRDFKNKKLYGHTFDWTFWTNCKGNIRSSQGGPEPREHPLEIWKREISKWSLFELQNWANMFVLIHPVHRHFRPEQEDEGPFSQYMMVEYEIMLRKQDAALEQLFGDRSCTLYDRLVAEEV